MVYLLHRFVRPRDLSREGQRNCVRDGDVFWALIVEKGRRAERDRRRRKCQRALRRPSPQQLQGGMRERGFGEILCDGILWLEFVPEEG